MDYKNGKIYRLVCGLDTFYVGSTTQPLYKRLYCHKTAFKRGDSPHCYKMVDDWNNVEIVLVEAFPCSCKEELHKRERFWIEELKPQGNKYIPCRTKKEWREENREMIAEWCKKYYQENSEKVAERGKKYRQENREAIRARKRAYYQTNKEALNQRGRAYHEANKEAISARMKAYYEANKDKQRENREAVNQRRRELYAKKKLEANSKDGIETKSGSSIG